MTHKPRLSFWQIWNMSFGFLGIQFGWALQMANMSAIYQYLGAKSDIAILWLAAPLTGLLIQPIIGYASDRTWGRLGRRSIMWTEYYGGPLARCSDLPYSKVLFSTPTAGADTVPHRSHDHLGDGDCGGSRVTRVGDGVRHEIQAG